MLLAVGLADGSGKVDTEHGYLIAGFVGVLVRTRGNADDIFLQQCRQNSLGYSLVFHQILEDGVVNRICNVNYHKPVFLLSTKIKFFFIFQRDKPIFRF